MKKKTLITAALPYANGELHIGHIAGNILPADIYARYKRKKGEEVIFICGSDEHGVPISISARKKGVSPQEIIDEYHNINKKSLEKLGMSFDIFSRTSSPLHKECASDFFMTLYKKGELIEKETEQYYDEKEKQFLADRYIRGECPKCGYSDAYGDQCEKCGITLSPNELINPRSFLSGEKPVKKKTKHWYLPLSKYQEWVEKWIIEEHSDWKANVYEQCKSWLKEGLQDRAITRDLDWGIPVPIDNTEGKVLYVWFDAPIGYISFTKELLGEKYLDWWGKDSNTRLIHFLGKDNIVFHCIIFPIMLKAHGGFILPDVVCGNEFMNLEGQKISKSREHAIWIKDFLEKHPNQQDVLRYVLCANMPENKDSNFTWEDFVSRNNNELVATLGNFVNRSVSMLEQYFNGEMAEIVSIKEEDIKAVEDVNNSIRDIEMNIERFSFKEALKGVMDIARIGNKYIDDTKPWREVKTNEDRTREILNTCIQIIAKLGIVCEPFLPFTAEKIKNILELKDTSWEHSLENNIVQTKRILKKSLLFEKINYQT